MNLGRAESNVLDKKILRPVSSDTTSLNYGDRLYKKGMKKKEEHERECKELKMEKEIKEKQDYTFRPIINKTSKNSIQDLDRTRPENRLIQIGQAIQEKREQQRTVNLIESKLKCTFHPEINKKSERMAFERSKNISMESIAENQANLLLNNKFEFLFEDAKRRQSHHDKVVQVIPDAECTFHPNIIPSQQNHASISTISERNPKNISPEKSKHLTEVVDNKTGQPFFKPKVGRPPKNDRNTASLPIGDYLYAQNKIKDEKLETKKNVEKEKEYVERQASHVQQTSKKIVENRKIGIFQEIFKQLDKDCDGSISAKNIDIACIVCFYLNFSSSKRNTGIVYSTFL